MALIPQPSSYRPDPAIAGIADFIADPVRPADFPQHILRFRNDRWAPAVGLADLDEAAWIDHFGRFAPLPGNLPEPLALRYHGHQFRVYNPDIGDGRGFLFAQLRDGAKEQEGGRLLDLGTKGSGQTPYSRFGDGRLTLKGGVREVLATEMLEALGVETSKSFSLIETGEALDRGDEPSPTRSSVLVRLGHGHIRIGSFQRLAAIGDADAMRRLIDYSLVALYGEAPASEPGEDGARRLIGKVAQGAARLAASYMAAGFVHGVLNSDNIAITAESFDYGPWRFTPRWDEAFTAAYFDHNGLYAFGRQAQAIHWDVVQLAIALRLVAAPEEIVPPLEAFPADYARKLDEALIRRLGLELRDAESDAALGGAIRAVLEGGVPIDRFFFDWRGGRLRESSGAYSPEICEAMRNATILYRARSGPVEGPEPGGSQREGFDALNPGGNPTETPLARPYWDGDAPCSLHIDEVEAIWSRIDAEDDWSAFHAKVAAIRDMGAAMRGEAQEA